MEKIMREKIWNYKNKAISKEEIEAFSKETGLPPLVAVILMNRGIKTEKKAGVMPAGSGDRNRTVPTAPFR